MAMHKTSITKDSYALHHLPKIKMFHMEHFKALI